MNLVAPTAPLEHAIDTIIVDTFGNDLIYDPNCHLVLVNAQVCKPSKFGFWVVWVTYAFTDVVGSKVFICQDLLFSCVIIYSFILLGGKIPF